MLMAYEAEGEATCEAGDLPPSLHRLKKKKEQHEERFPRRGLSINLVQ